MGSRSFPLDCGACGGVVDWGDFGPDSDDGSVGATCTCDLGEARWVDITADTTPRGTIVFPASDVEIERLKKAVGEQTESARRWQNRDRNARRKLARARAENEELRAALALTIDAMQLPCRVSDSPCEGHCLDPNGCDVRRAAALLNDKEDGS